MHISKNNGCHNHCSLLMIFSREYSTPRTLSGWLFGDECGISGHSVTLKLEETTSDVSFIHKKCEIETLLICDYAILSNRSL